MERIELRSEKVRNIIGEIPPFLTRTGTMIILVIVLALGAASCMIHYPITAEGDGKMEVFVNRLGDSLYSASLLMPYKYRAFFKEKRKVDMTFEGHDGLTLRDSLDQFASDTVFEKDGENYCLVTVGISWEEVFVYGLQPGMKVHGVSVIDDRTIWQLLFNM